MRERLAELGRHAEFGRELKGFAQDAEGLTARIAGADGEETVRDPLPRGRGWWPQLRAARARRRIPG